MHVQEINRAAGSTIALAAVMCLAAGALAQGGDTVDDATVVSSLPFNDTGTTVGYANDYDEACPYAGSTSPDVVYAYAPTGHMAIGIDLCASGYDTKVYVYENEVIPGGPIACNDDGCPGGPPEMFRSQIPLVELTAGNTYYIVIDGWNGDAGAYDLLIEEVFIEVFACPPGAMLEGEPICGDDYVDQFNAGCGGAPPVFSPISSGETICGTSGTFLVEGVNYRDTDWYEMTVDGPGTLELTALADFPVQIFLLDGNDGCEMPAMLGTAEGQPFEVISITVEIDGGLYWPWIGPSVFTDVPCGSQYWYAATFIPGDDCPEDLNGDSTVDVEDLLELLGAWGQSGVPADVDGSGTVEVGDLLMLLAAWGDCD